MYTKVEKWKKKIVVLEYTKLDRYLNLEKENYKVLKFHENIFFYFEISVSLFSSYVNLLTAPELTHAKMNRTQ